MKKISKKRGAPIRYLEERKKIIHYGKAMLEKRLTTGSGGNLSIFIRKENLFLITPSGIGYFSMQPEDIVLMDLEGNSIESSRKPSSEYSMHMLLYKNRSDIDAVVHTHSPYATAFSCLQKELPPIHYLVAVSGGSNVRCTKYETYGTEELALTAVEAMLDRKVAFLANHGLLAGGRSIENAFSIAEEIEFCCMVYQKAKSMGEDIVLLSDDEMKRLVERFKGYGQ